jgi:hypothetical protein
MVILVMTLDLSTIFVHNIGYSNHICDEGVSLSLIKNSHLARISSVTYYRNDSDELDVEGNQQLLLIQYTKQQCNKYVSCIL